MNKNIGTLTIEMAANIARLQQGMDQANKYISRAMGGIQHAAGLASTALGLIGAGISVAGIVAFGNRGIDMLAQLDDAAQKTGSSVENLSKIQQVATEFSHDFGLIDSSISKLAKGMATFDSETNSTQRALKALGIESRDAAGNLRDPSQVMIEIAKNLQHYEDGAAKAALMTDLFGKSGADLLPIMNDMADNVDRFRPITAEAAAQAALFQDQMGRMRSQVDKAVMSFATGLFPALTRITASTFDASDGMNFFTRSGKAVGDMFVWLLEKGSAAWMMFGNFGDMAGTTARQLMALAKGDFKTIGQLEKNLDNEMGKRLVEHQNYVSKITGGNKQLEESVANVKKKLDYQTGTKGPAAPASDYDRAIKSATDYIAKLHEETEAIGLNSVQVKMLVAARAAAQAPLEAQRMAIMESAQAWALTTQAQVEAADAAKALEAEEKKRLDGYAALVSADEKALESLKQKNDLLEFGAGAVAAMGQADLQAALDRAWAADNIDINVIAMLERRLELSKQLADAARRGEALEAAKEAAKEASRAWENTARDINRSLTDALLRGFESGKSFLKNLRDTAVNMFQTLVLRPVIQAGMAPITGSLSSLLSGTASAGTGGGGLGGGGILSSLGSLLGMGGGGAGGAAASTAFSGIGGAGGAAAGIGGMGGMAGMSGLMAAAGPFAAAAAAAFAIGSLTSSFGKGKKIFGIKGDSPLNFIAPIIGILAGLFGKGPKKYGPQLLNGNFSEDGFSGNFQADWTRKVGLFGGKKRGTTDFAISNEQVGTLNDTVTGITDTFEKLIKYTGDADRALTGWSFAVRRAIETEEQQTQLATDLANSIGQKLIPELTALQLKGESLIDTAARAQAEFALMDAAIDLTGQSFGKTGLASLGLRDSLVQLLGGLQGASATLQPFFDNFYTDSERVASTGRLMNAELERLGITTIPDTREQFRALVEAQDLSTDAGQEMFAALVRLAPAFATVTDAIGQAAIEAATEAQRIADSIQLLTTDSFATLFDYTKYIRLAANAGVTAAQPAGPVFQAPAQVFPSFAVGTNSLPGDMTINAHAGERIVPAADNRELMRRLAEPNEGMKVMADEIRQLRSELKAANLAIAKNTSQSARILDRWEGGGMPEPRTA